MTAGKTRSPSGAPTTHPSILNFSKPSQSSMPYIHLHRAGLLSVRAGRPHRTGRARDGQLAGNLEKVVCGISVETMPSTLRLGGCAR